MSVTFQRRMVLWVEQNNGTVVGETNRIVEHSIKNDDWYFLPTVLPGVHPMYNINQLVFNWQVNTMPTGASFVSITPYAVPAFQDDPSGQPAFEWLNGAISAARFTFDDLDAANNRVYPKTYEIYKTAADPQITDAQGALQRFGTRTPLPLCDLYVAFRVSTDGADDTGNHTIWVEAGWS